MRIGYSKSGRSWSMDRGKQSTIGGDIDVYNALDRLARAHPDHEFVLVGRNTAQKPGDVGLPSNVTNPWADGLSDEIREVTSGRASPMTVEDRRRIVKGMDKLTRPLFESCDGHVVWAGQQGTSNLPIPSIKGEGDENGLTKTQDAFILYGSYIDLGINAWRWEDPESREEVWLCPDPRNYLKSRSVAWPLRHPVLGQYDQTREWKHYRYRKSDIPMPPWTDVVRNVEEQSSVWIAKTRYVYAGVELTALDDPISRVGSVHVDLPRSPFGILANENRPYVAHSRRRAMQEWVLPWYPQVPVVGVWTEKTKQELGIRSEPEPSVDVLDILGRWRSTFTMPASGSGWATAKPWECFLARTVCFFHPRYDTQGHIIPTLQQLERGEHDLDEEGVHLARWLRPPTPDDLKKAAVRVASDDDAWQWLVQAQYRLLLRRWEERRCLSAVEERLGLRVHEGGG